MSLLCLNEFVTTILVKMFSTLIVFPAKELQFTLISPPPPLLDCWLLAVKNLLHIVRDVTKISSWRVIATSRRGKNQLQISWGSIFAVGHFHSSWGKSPTPNSYCQPCIMHMIMGLNFDRGGVGAKKP